MHRWRISWLACAARRTTGGCTCLTAPSWWYVRSGAGCPMAAWERCLPSLAGSITFRLSQRGVQHRRVLVDWIAEAGTAFHLDRTTIHVAVSVGVYS